MAGKRSPGKKFIGCWIPEKLRDQLTVFTRSRSITDTDAITRALRLLLDQCEHENEEQ